MSPKYGKNEKVKKDLKSIGTTYSSVYSTDMMGSWFEKEIFGMKDKKRTKQHRFTVGKALSKRKAGLHPVKELALGFSDWVRKLRSILHVPQKQLKVLPEINRDVLKKDAEPQQKIEAVENPILPKKEKH